MWRAVDWTFHNATSIEAGQTRHGKGPMKYLDQELDTRTVGAFVGIIGLVILLEGRPDSVGQWLGMTGAMVAFYIVCPAVVWIIWAVLYSATMLLMWVLSAVGKGTSFVFGLFSKEQP